MFVAEDLSVLSRPAAAPDQVLAYGDAADQIADVRFGGQRAAERPLLLVLHGGFWRPQYDRKEAASMSAALAALGWTVATLEYRRIPGDPDASLKDIASGLEKLPGMIAGHNGRVVLVGNSAGGHLALWVAAQSWATVLKGVLALAPIADLGLAQKRNLGQGAVMAFLGTTAAERPDADPLQLAAPAARIVIAHGTDDAVVPLEISASYLAAFPCTRLVRLQGSGHFALIDPLNSAWPVVVEELQQLCA
ncbi:alpha/beta hydrolase [Collimonas pratensis]|uniref:alpha/beta hydrolase n=1 Tax=Collimonas pratensis TaxID=279113 RepID=UPI0019802DD2|nr:alpha/beta hydrolase [Collimonas pratensis]